MFKKRQSKTKTIQNKKGHKKMIYGTTDKQTNWENGLGINTEKFFFYGNSYSLNKIER